MLTRAVKHMLRQAFRRPLLHSVGSPAAHLTLNHPAALLPLPFLFSDSELSGCDKLMGLRRKAFTML